jgi:isopenicillin-N N-acyltransferase-like protein
VNIGWSGWIGSIQGFNSRKVSVSEIGVYFRDDSFGKESRFGIPFTVNKKQK